MRTARSSYWRTSSGVSSAYEAFVNYALAEKGNNSLASKDILIPKRVDAETLPLMIMLMTTLSTVWGVGNKK